MRHAKLLRAMTLVFALSMMAGYVVYSRQQHREIAPGSKAGIVNPTPPAAVATGPATNGTRNLGANPAQQPAVSNDLVFASSSKSIAPLVTIKPGKAAPEAGTPFTPAQTNLSLRTLTNSPTAKKSGT